MAIHTNTRRPLFRVPNRKPVIVSVASAALGAAATVAVIAGWSAFGPGQAVNASDRATTATSASVSTRPNYPASREGVRGQVDSDSPLVAAVEGAQPIRRQPNYPASREGVRGHVAADASLVAAAEGMQPIGPQPNYPASRERVRGHVAEE